MSFTVLIPNAVKRDLKRIDRHILETLKKIIFEEIAISPELGKPLKGWSKVFAWKKRIAKADFRIAYRFDVKQKVVYLLLVKSRENFYEELKKRIG